MQNHRETDGPEQRHREVAGRARRRDQDHVLLRLAQIPRVHRNRLRPAKRRQIQERENQRHGNGANRIDVSDRVQRESPQQFRRAVTKTSRRPAVGNLMQRDGK